MRRALEDNPVTSLDMEQLDSVGRQLVSNAVHFWYNQLTLAMPGAQFGSQFEDAVMFVVSQTTGGLYSVPSFFPTQYVGFIVFVVSLGGFIASPLYAGSSATSSVPLPFARGCTWRQCEQHLAEVGAGAVW